MTALLLTALLTDPSIPLDPAQVWTAPTALSMDRAGLPFPSPGPGGTWLPKPSDEWVRDRLAAYEQYPAQCQARLNAAHSIAEARLTEALSVDAAADSLRAAEVEQEAADRWPTWAVAGSFALGVVVGGATLWAAAQVVR